VCARAFFYVRGRGVRATFLSAAKQKKKQTQRQQQH
jgi:hypothetical protein